MRRLALLLALVALPAASALEPIVVLVDWQHGRALAPTSPLLSPPTADAFPFHATACHRHLLLDLLYEPDNATLAASGVGTLALSYEFRVEVWHDGARVLQQRVTRSAYGIPLGALAESGDHEVRLSLGWGADVDWSARLRGRLATEDPACNPPL